MSQLDDSRSTRSSLRMSSTEEPPGWQRAAEGTVPSPGDHVLCTEGPAEVVRVLGKTSDGSRLLELRCPDRPQPFFAASSNVLVRDPTTKTSDFLDPLDAVGGV